MRVRFFRSKAALRIIASAILAFAIAACGKASIVGKWRMSGSEATVWEFRTNGAVLVGDVNGTYKFGDQERIKIQTPFATSVYQLEISGDQMTLREPGGTELEFTRIKQNAVLIP
jgi:hypothetical protein